MDPEIEMLEEAHAAVYDPRVPAAKPGKRGPKAKKGPQLPKPKETAQKADRKRTARGPWLRALAEGVGV